MIGKQCLRRVSRLRFPFWAFAFLLLAMPAFGQRTGTEGGGRRASDELNEDNAAVVAASPEQIAGVLAADPGLLLELKQWIASQAAGRGQVVLEQDLTDAEILRRLTWDREFRLAATRLLQRYGHLLPNIKPDSDIAQEKEEAKQARAARAERAAQGSEGRASGCQCAAVRDKSAYGSKSSRAATGRSLQSNRRQPPGALRAHVGWRHERQ